MSQRIMGAVLERLLVGAARHYPFYRGRGWLALSGVFRRRSEAANDVLRAVLKSGEQIDVVSDDYIGRMVRFFGDLDPAVSAVAKQRVRTGDVVIDVGANVGVMTLQMASLVGPTGKVFAFEPVKRLHALLIRSIAANKFENVSVWNLALSNTSGSGSMRVAEGSLGCSTLDVDASGELCEVRMLDEVDFGSDFKRPRLLKIDVEGHEGEVLGGATRFLSMYPPDYVLFESHPARGPFWERAEVKILVGLGYSFEVVARDSLAKPILRRIQTGESDFGKSYDFIASLNARTVA